MSVYLGNNEVGIGVYEKPAQKPYTGFKFFGSSYYTEAKVKMTRYGSNSQYAPQVSLLYSMDDGQTWQPYVLDTWITLAINATVCFMAGPEGNERFSSNNINAGEEGWKFVTENNRTVYPSGNIMSLLTQDYETADEVPSYAFAKLFASSYGSASDYYCFSIDPDYYQQTPPRKLVLPATKVGVCGYERMFSGQLNVYDMPDLPATTVETRAYHEMFNRTGLRDLSGKCLPCRYPGQEAYYYMFGQCSNLQHGPLVGAANADGLSCCGSIFSGCGSLKDAYLPYTNSFDGQVFDDCWDVTFIDLGELNFLPRLGSSAQSKGVIAANTDFQGVYPSQYMPNGWTYVCKTTGEVLTPPEN